MTAVFRVDGNFDRNMLAGASCAFGVFDGVHKGHRFIVHEAVRAARESGGACIVLTFDIDPDEVFRATTHKKLMTNGQRLATLAALDGVDAVAVFPFTRDFAVLAPQDFLDEMFGGHAPASMHVGRDFHFGAKAAGDIASLERWGRANGMIVHGCDLLQYKGSAISSTRIRALLSEGAIEQADELLGAPYTVEGMVEPGRAAGRDMGFRTANLRIDASLRALADGVYAAYVLTEDGGRYKAAVSVGVSPTFEEVASANLEVHILDFEGSLYGQTLRVEFAAYLRPMIKFETTQKLIDTVKGNIQWVRENL